MAAEKNVDKMLDANFSVAWPVTLAVSSSLDRSVGAGSVLEVLRMTYDARSCRSGEDCQRHGLQRLHVIF